MVSETDLGDKCHVPRCGRPVQGAYLCAACADELVEALRDVPTLASALEVAYLRQQRFSVTRLSPRKLDESPLPFNDKAGRIRRELTRELVRWTLQVQFAHGEAWMPVPYGAKGSARAMSARLLDAMPYFRGHPAGVQAHRAFTDIWARALRCVDRPPDLVYLGVCSMVVDGAECPEDLYAEWGKDHARCGRCRHDHRVEERRAVLLGAVKDQLAPAADIARGLSGLDLDVTADRIRQWKHRKRIEQRGVGYDGAPLYRVGDVIDLLLTEAARKGKGKTK